MASCTEYLPVRFLTSRRTMFVMSSVTTVVLLLLIQKASHHHHPLAHSDIQLITVAARRNSSEMMMKEVEMDFTSRKAQYDRVCKTRVSGSVGEVYYNHKTNFSVCPIHKAGSSFWRRVFHFLDNNTGNTNSPFQFSRNDVHQLPSETQVKVSKHNYWHWDDKTLIDATHKVLFVGDPYERLWSVYVDSFLLPGAWLDHGLSILRRRNEKDGKKKVILRKCASNITFDEFLRYVVDMPQDNQWLPVHRVCNPCLFHPQFVGKMETFHRDATYILKQGGLEALTQGYDHRHYAREEVRMLTEYYFQVYETRQGLRSCLTHSGIAQRLWQALSLTGYIGQNFTLPQKQFSEELDSVGTMEAKEIAVKFLLKAHLASPALSLQSRQVYRRRVMAEQYRRLPAELLQSVVDVYNTDFVLFGYASKPVDIFPV